MELTLDIFEFCKDCVTKKTTWITSCVEQRLILRCDEGRDQ